MTVAMQDLHSMTIESKIRISEKDINDLAAKHFEEQCLTSGRLNSEVEALHQSQRKEYRAWLMAMYENEALSPTLQYVVLKLQEFNNCHILKILINY